jgi:hypothetical protein
MKGRVIEQQRTDFSVSFLGLGLTFGPLSQPDCYAWRQVVIMCISTVFGMITLVTAASLAISDFTGGAKDDKKDDDAGIHSA